MLANLPQEAQMAHPFRYFRKHQKVFLAIAAVIAMFVFVIGDQITAYIGQGGGSRDPNEVVVSWKGGKLSAMELENLTQRRFFISEFLKRLASEGYRRVIDEGGTPQTTAPNFMLNQRATGRQVATEVIKNRLLSDQARKAGMTISDDVINHYLKEVGFRRVSNREVVTILQSIRQGNRRELEDMLFAGLRELLLAEAYMSTFRSNYANVTPQQRWEDWQRVNERISLEAAALPVSDFVKDVPVPTEAELKAFYEQYKNNEARVPHLVSNTILPSADPGFKVPRKVKLNYLVGDINAWSEKYRDSIADAEIADYYERNKRTQFIKSEGDDSEFDEELFQTPPAATEGETPATGTDAPSTDPPAAETPATETEEAASDETPATESPAEDAEAPSDNDSGGVLTKGKFQLTAFQADPADSDVAAEEVVEGEARETPAEGESETTENATADAESEASSTDEADAEEQEVKVEYVPLEEVKDTIRNKLARDKAVVEVRKAMDRVYAELDTEYKPYSFAVVTAKTEKKELPKPPAALTNLKERAAETGLTSEETVLLTQRELADTYVGKARDVQTDTQPVGLTTFGDLNLYQPLLAKDLDGNFYLVTKVEDVAEKIPSFDEAEDQVLKQFKEREAAKLALKKAEELAAEAQKSGDSLKVALAGKPYEITNTDFFSFLTFGTTANMQQGVRLGDAPPLEAVGPDMMRKAFELKDNEVAAMLNYDQSNAYVFRIDRRESTPEELRNLFLKEANNWYGGGIMLRGHVETQEREILAEILENSGLDEERTEKYFDETFGPEQ
jgi:hypothetical protein